MKHISAHSTILLWLVYINIVGFFWFMAFKSGLLGVIISHDHAYLSRALLGAYLVGEIVAFWNILKLDRMIATRVNYKGPPEKRWDAEQLESLTNKTTFSDWIASRVEMLGMLATVVGIVWALWPFLQGADIERIKSNLSPFFSGVAVAFIPTAVSFAAKILLDCTTKIIDRALDEIRELY